ncbi:ankyrin repeat domain-containing protein [Noviherbaspirillum pedocola]|uniref:Ankyrin repeat domain-containing protein n=1 Tax=Noviherbaspirillum pedocola TaxID=2801341 RepID=A0A934WAE8_9BURK|nr:ankyrin repeat domain-containing protein [Noviherbaspirillum pedocola]MBK4738849.1 ankyrin repeat domain-containing protein [Noviherbaspirillum pedocola]
MQGLPSSSSHSSSDTAQQQPLEPRQTPPPAQPAGNQQPSHPDAALQPNVATPPGAPGLLHAVPAAPQAATAPLLAPAPGMHSGQKRATPDGGSEPRDTDNPKRPRTATSAATPPRRQSRDADDPDKNALPHPSRYDLYASSFAIYNDADGMDVDQPTSSAASSNGAGNTSPWQRQPRLETTHSPRQLIELRKDQRYAELPSLITALVFADPHMFYNALTEEHDDVNATDQYGCTALHYAAALGLGDTADTVDAVHALLQCGIEINAINTDGKTALHYAAANGAQAVTNALLAYSGRVINAIDNEERTALLHAVAHGHIAIADALLAQHDIQVNIADSEGNTALMYAVKHACSSPGHEPEALIGKLLGIGNIDVNRSDLKGNTPLLHAVSGGKTEIALMLLRAPRIDVSARNAAGKTAIMLACNDAALIGSLLSSPGIDVNACDNKGSTALIRALESREYEKAWQLLRAPGIDVNVKNQKGHTAFSWAFEDQNGAVAALLFARVDHIIASARQHDDAALALTAAAGETATVSSLLGKPDVNVNAVHANNLTALMLAAANGHPDIVRVLLAAPGIDVNATDAAGFTALMLAAEMGCEATVRLLLDARGIDVHASSANDHTALALAAAQGHGAIVKALLHMPGGERASTPMEESSAFGHAWKKGHADIMRMLLARPEIGIDVLRGSISPCAFLRDETDLRKFFALTHFMDMERRATEALLLEAAMKNNESAVRLLVAMPGININCTDISGMTALMHAAQHGHRSMVRMLLSVPGIRLDIGEGTEDGTAADLARKNWHDDICKELRDHASLMSLPFQKLQSVFEAVFARAAIHREASTEQISRIDEICERLESGTCAAADIAAFSEFAVILPSAVRQRFARSLAFGFITGHFREADGSLTETCAAFIGDKVLRMRFDEIAYAVSAATANINLYRSDRFNLLGFAAASGNVRMIRALVRLGAHVDLPSPNGETAFAIAIENRQWQACAELVACGAQATLPLHDGRPALYHIVGAACAAGQPEAPLIDLLRELRARDIPFDIPFRSRSATQANAAPLSTPIALLGAVDLLERHAGLAGPAGNGNGDGNGNEGPNGRPPVSTADTSAGLSATYLNRKPADESGGAPAPAQ